MPITFNTDEVYSIGIQIEKNGRLFYQTAANLTDNPQLTKLFSDLADWENEHVELFKHLKASITGDYDDVIFDPDNIVHQYLNAAASDNIFVNDKKIIARAKSCRSSQEALLMAIDFEKDSVVYYSTMKEIVRDDLGKSELDRLILEEIKHIGQLTEELKKIQS